MKYPNTLHKLIERSQKRRILLRQYKFEALKDIINLTESKTIDYDLDVKREALYDKIMKKLNLDNEAHGYAVERIKSLRTIANNARGNQDMSKDNSSISDEVNSPTYILKKERKKMEKEMEDNTKFIQEVKYDEDEKEQDENKFSNNLLSGNRKFLAKSNTRKIFKLPNNLSSRNGSPAKAPVSYRRKIDRGESINSKSNFFPKNKFEFEGGSSEEEEEKKPFQEPDQGILSNTLNPIVLVPRNRKSSKVDKNILDLKRKSILPMQILTKQKEEEESK